MKKVSLVVCAIVAMSQSIFAELITIQASGYLQTVDSALESQFSVGESFSFTYAYDTTTIDLEPDWKEGRYGDALEPSSLIIDDYTLMLNGGDILIQTGDATDSYTVQSGYSYPKTGDSVGGKVPASFSMQLKDIDGEAFPNDDLPKTAPDLSMFEDKSMRLMFADYYTSAAAWGPAYVYGKVTSIAAIPEPSVLALVGVFGGGLWVVRRFFTL